ncbi:hypothetical protein Plav_0859 [Parvibaculum lavamentivorans DS-1]|uniref:Uncharacterized protein n=2 Tax=Parvibaculum lavamentivorans TaxID=256618 RepID=A7HRE9_PARL1|nr:hypothetical protein Plav_0859 [Parvibaculum lavamentivorans DS-1]
MLIAIGAASAPFDAFSGSPYTDFDTICTKDAGLRINEPVDDVSGYAIYPGEGEPSVEEIVSGHVSDAPALGGCFPCIEELVKNGYQYVEAFYVSAKDRRFSPFVEHQDYFVSKTGLYRYELIERDRGNNACGPFDRMLHESERLLDVNPAFVDTTMRRLALDYRAHSSQMEGKCVSVTSIDRFSAPYRIGKSREVIDRPDGAIIYRKRTFVESADGTVVAEGIFYSYYEQRPAHHIAIAERRCGSLILPPLTELLRPHSAHSDSSEAR